MAQCTDCDATIEYKGNGSQKTFTFQFEYFETTDIHVAQYDEEKREYVDLTYGTDWRFLDPIRNPTVIQLTTPPTETIVIYRCTDIDQMQATFHPGYSVKAEDLNNDFNQLRLAVEEGRCGIGSLKEEIRNLDDVYLNNINVDDDGDLVKSNSNLTIDDEHVATTKWIDNRYWDQCGETTYLEDTWVNEIDDAHVPTTGAVERRLTEVAAKLAAPVDSVNGQTGVVVLDASDVGAIPTGGAVTKITAGTNITISPTDGTGEVTINSSGSGGGGGAVDSVNGQTGVVVLDAADVGALPDSYIPPAAPVVSVNGETGAVVLNAADVGALPDTYVPPGAAVSSVNSKTGAVVLDASDVGALGATATAADSDKLGGKPAADYALTSEIADVWVFRGVTDPTTLAPPPNPAVGDIYAADVAGQVLASWNVTGNGQPNPNPIGAVVVGSLIGRGFNQWALIGDANAEVLQNLDQVLAQGNTSTRGATFAGGAFAIESDGDISTNIRGQGNIELDSTGAFTNPKVKLFAATGNATFAGTVISGGNPANGEARGTSINEYGTVRAANTSGAIFEGYTVATELPTSQIDVSGAASFASQLSSGNVAGSGYRQGFLCVPDGDGSYVQVYGKNGDVTPTFSVYNGDLSDNVATISSAGAATFAGTIQANKPRSSTAGEGTGGLCISPSDTTIYYNFRVDSVDNALRIDTGAGADQILFSNEGAASFAGDVTVGDYQSGTAGKNGFEFRSSGELVQNRNGGDAYTLYNNSATKTVTISAAGAATFADAVISIGDPTNGVTNGTKLGSTVQCCSPAGGTVWAGFEKGTSTPTSSILASGKATFLGRVNCGSTAVNDVAIKAENNTSAVATIYAQQFNDSGSVWSGRDKNNIETSKIGVAGNAEFEGSITIPDAGYRDSQGVKLFNSGLIHAVGTSTSNVFMGFDVADGASGASTSTIKASGDATFQGDINKQSSGKSRFVVQESFTRLYTGSPSNFDDYTISLNNNDGSADFAGTVTANGYSMANLAQL